MSKQGIIVTKECFTCHYREQWPHTSLFPAEIVTLNLTVGNAGTKGVLPYVHLLPDWLVCDKCQQPTISMKIEMLPVPEYTNPETYYPEM